MAPCWLEDFETTNNPFPSTLLVTRTKMKIVATCLSPLGSSALFWSSLHTLSSAARTCFACLPAGNRVGVSTLTSRERQAPKGNVYKRVFQEKMFPVLLLNGKYCQKNLLYNTTEKDKGLLQSLPFKRETKFLISLDEPKNMINKIH